MEIATIVNIGRELDAYPLGSRLLERVLDPKQQDLAWLEHEEPRALGQLVLLCNDFLIPKVKSEIAPQDTALVERALVVASTVLARRATEGK